MTPSEQASATFDFAGNDQGYSIVTQPDGKIVVAGESEGNIAILELLGQSDQSGEPPTDATAAFVAGTLTLDSFTGVPDTLTISDSTFDPGGIDFALTGGNWACITGLTLSATTLSRRP